MSVPHSRRAFFPALASLGAAAVALVSGSRVANAATSNDPVRPRTEKWDDSWTERLTHPQRAVMDVASIDSGLGVAQTGYYLESVKEVFDSDTQAVLVIRHAAVPMIVAPAIWEKYDVGKTEKIAGRTEGEFVTTNIYAKRIAALQERGVIVLGCDLALQGFGYKLARQAKAEVSDVDKELRANLLPGVILQPTGVYAVHRAQRAGCTYVRCS